MMKLLSIVGARPQFIKLAPLARALATHYADQVQHIIVHTGQHYDHSMSDVFFDELQIPRADYALGVGSGPHGQQTGRMLEKIEVLYGEVKPDVVAVYGDTNSTLAGALAAVKMHIPVTHIEAGLRSFNRQMPEEINRIMTDHSADQLMAPTPTAMQHLAREGLAARSLFTGDIMQDAIRFNSRLADQQASISQRLQLQRREYAVVTVHRAENTDGERLLALLSGLNQVAALGLRLVFPLHPRTQARIRDLQANWQPHPNLECVEPLGYLDMLQLLTHARCALTDSGGLQKEAFFLNVPCITLRDETEWVETVQVGGNQLVGCDTDKLLAAVQQQLSTTAEADFSAAAEQYFGAGDAAEKIIQACLQLARETARI